MLVVSPSSRWGRGQRTPEMALSADYERSSFVPSLSSISGVGDSAIITIQPMPTFSEAGNGWIEHSVMLTGANGFRPTIRLIFADQYFTAWTGFSPNRHGMWSADNGVTWTYFDNCAVNSGAGYIEMRHNTAFTSNTILLSRSRQLSVHNCGTWLDGLLSSYSSFFGPAPSALAYSPGPNLSGFGAQSLIAAEFSQQSQLYWLGSTGNTFTGLTIPPTPKWCGEINDTSLMPPMGAPKDYAVITAGTHAGEDLGDYAMQKFVEYLFGSSAEAQNIRRYFRILFYPCMNPPGRSGGHFRSQYQVVTGWDDLNRHFTNPSAGFQTNDIGRSVLVPDLAGNVPVWIMDFHGTYLSNGFAIVEDAGVPLQSTFRTQLASFTGFTIGDDANTPADSVTGYFRSLGTPLYIVFELGDLTPKPDSDYTTFGQGIVQTLDYMKNNGDI